MPPTTKEFYILFSFHKIPNWIGITPMDGCSRLMRGMAGEYVGQG